MSEDSENDGMAEQLEQNLGSVDNDSEGTSPPSKDEETKEKEAVKSSSPVVYISLVWLAFFILGVYEVRSSNYYLLQDTTRFKSLIMLLDFL